MAGETLAQDGAITAWAKGGWERFRRDPRVAAGVGLIVTAALIEWGAGLVTEESAQQVIHWLGSLLPAAVSGGTVTPHG